MDDRASAPRFERIIPHPSVSVLRRRGRSSSGAFLAGVALVAIPLLVALVAWNIHQRDQATFQTFAQRAEQVSAARLRGDPDAYDGRAIRLHGRIVQVVAADGSTEVLLATAADGSAAETAGPIAAYDTDTSTLVLIDFAGEVAVQEGAAVDVWGIGSGTVAMTGRQGSATVPGVHGAYVRRSR